MFLSNLILKTSFVDYHDGVYFVAMCKFWIVQKCNRNFDIIPFQSKTNAIFDGADNLKVETRKL